MEPVAQPQTRLTRRSSRDIPFRVQPQPCKFPEGIWRSGFCAGPSDYVGLYGRGKRSLHYSGADGCPLGPRGILRPGLPQGPIYFPLCRSCGGRHLHLEFYSGPPTGRPQLAGCEHWPPDTTDSIPIPALDGTGYHGGECPSAPGTHFGDTIRGVALLSLCLSVHSCTPPEHPG